MIYPYRANAINGLYVEDANVRATLREQAQSLPALLLNSSAAANVVMLGSGYFTPLSGFMDKGDALSVAQNLHTRSGMFWPIPILNLTSGEHTIRAGSSIALCDPNVDGAPVLAIQNVESVEHLTDDEIEKILINVYRTAESQHPGVASFTALGRQLVAGPIRVLSYSYFETEFSDIFHTASEIRNQIQVNGWATVVAFQTRNPMHRGHEELCKMAKNSLAIDGILIHMLLGKLKSGDIPAKVRVAAIREMVDKYFPKNSVMISGYGFDMLYAGPREAVLHAIVRQNAGCSHLIIGRDHAGVGQYYGPFDAQTIFDEEVPEGVLSIQIFRADHTAYSKKLERVVMMRDAPDHRSEDFVLLSGTRAREMLEAGEPPPTEFMRPEVASILMDYYRKRELPR
jgi:sulfate adenylyltransferase